MSTSEGLTPGIAQKYTFKEYIGHGTYGKVVKVASDEHPHQAFALKIMGLTPKGEIAGTSGISKSTLVEISLLKRLKHPNIVRLIEIDADNVTDTLNVVMELAACTLEHKIENIWFQPNMRKRAYSQIKHQIDIAFQTICALAYLHQNSIIHLDLKPANILIRQDESVALADFGISERSTSVKSKGHHIVTWPYRAPEIVCGKRSYDVQSDIWSLGVIFLQLFFSLRLVSRQGDTESHIFENFLKRVGPVSSQWSQMFQKNEEACPVRPHMQQTEETKVDQIPPYHEELDPFFEQYYGKEIHLRILDLIDSCLRYIPGERATAKQLLEHPLFKVRHHQPESSLQETHECRKCMIMVHNDKYSRVQSNIQQLALIVPKLKHVFPKATLELCCEIYNRVQRRQHSMKPSILEVACASLAAKIMNHPYGVFSHHHLSAVANVSSSDLHEAEINVLRMIDWSVDGPFEHEDWGTLVGMGMTKGTDDFMR